MSKHTPGPWKAYESTERCPLPAGCYVEVGTLADGGAKIGAICDLVAQGENGRYSSTVTTANAFLLAAAPELLEACRQFVHWYEVASTEHNRDMAFYAAKDAIAKAEGVQASEGEKA